MRPLFHLFLISAALFLPSQQASARIISAAFFFNANDNSDQSSVSRTVSVGAIDGQGLTFDFDLSITSNTGNVVDTSSGLGLSSNAGSALGAGDSLTFSVGISNVSSVGSFNLDFDSLTLAFVGTVAATAADDAGTVTTVAGSQSWSDIDDGADFSGHISPPDSRAYGGSLLSNGANTSQWEGGQGFWQYSNPGTTDINNTVIIRNAGFDVQETYVASGGGSGVPVTTFTHAITGGSSFVTSVVVQVTANPEPSSIFLGLLILCLAFWKFGWRRLLSMETSAS